MAARIVRTAVAALASAGTFTFGQDTALLQDERNTIEVFPEGKLDIAAALFHEVLDRPFLAYPPGISPS